MTKNGGKNEGNVENVKCPKMDSPDLIPEGFERVQGTPGKRTGPQETPDPFLEIIVVSDVGDVERIFHASEGFEIIF